MHLHLVLGVALALAPPPSLALVPEPPHLIRGAVTVNNLFDRKNIASAFLNPDLVGGKPARIKAKSLPMLFSGIVFVRSFAVAEDKSNALGANLIGALVGALLQSITFITGIKALLLVVAGFYLLSKAD